MATPELDRVFNPIVLIFRIMGLWPTGSNAIVYKMYGIVHLTIFSLLLTTTMMIQLLAFTDFEQITKTMYMSLSQLALCLKVVNFYVRMQLMQKLLETTKRFQLNSMAEEILFNERMRFIAKIVMMLIVSVNVAHFSAEFKAIMTPELLLPFPCWYPASWFDDGIKYYLAYSHQSLGAFFTSNLNGAMEAYSAAFLFMIGAQMEILAIRLRSIGIDDKPPVPSSVSHRRDKLQNRKWDHMQHIKKCIQVHQQILMFESVLPMSSKQLLLIN